MKSVSRITMMAFQLVLVFVTVFASSVLSESALAQSASRGMKVPAQIESTEKIPQAVKDLLDRDFRSRFPLASPFKIDVLKTSVTAYSTGLVDNGFGGYDTRHYFRVRAIHANGGKVLVEISIIERSNAEPDQDSILVESFRVISWAP